MDKDYYSVLWQEFSAQEETFLFQLRIDLFWDKEAFDRLTDAMRACCKDYERKQQSEEQHMQAQQMMLPRWLASGFWYLSIFVREHTSHPVWKKWIAQEPEYFQKAYERLNALASWFFEGQSPWEDEEKGWLSTLMN
ncbi:MAG TPA: hypothetical protein VFV38_44780 [Ktedonobacteraceae bacterium]|nr:hypothetical protein [Ktedonobacteraceae bacterium]